MTNRFPSPMTEEAGLRKITGASGVAFPSSFDMFRIVAANAKNLAMEDAGRSQDGLSSWRQFLC